MIKQNNISTEKWHYCKLAGITQSQQCPNTQHAFIECATATGKVFVCRHLKCLFIFMHKCITHITCQCNAYYSNIVSRSNHEIITDGSNIESRTVPQLKYHDTKERYRQQLCGMSQIYKNNTVQSKDNSTLNIPTLLSFSKHHKKNDKTKKLNKRYSEPAQITIYNLWKGIYLEKKS